MATKLIYNRTKKAAMNPIKAFSKTGDFFIAIGEALESRNPKGELKKLANKYDLRVKDLKEAVETYIKYDSEDFNGLDDNDIKHITKELGFSEDIKEFSSSYNPKRSPSSESAVVAVRLDDPKYTPDVVKLLKYPGYTPISESRKMLVEIAKKENPKFDIFIPTYEDNAKSIMEFMLDLCKDLYRFRY